GLSPTSGMFASVDSFRGSREAVPGFVARSARFARALGQHALEADLEVAVRKAYQAAKLRGRRAQPERQLITDGLEHGGADTKQPARDGRPVHVKNAADGVDVQAVEEVQAQHG